MFWSGQGVGKRTCDWPGPAHATHCRMGPYERVPLRMIYAREPGNFFFIFFHSVFSALRWVVNLGCDWT